MDNINIACIGAGYWGKNLVRNYYNLPGCRLKTCCDLNPDILSSIPTSLPHPQLRTTKPLLKNSKTS